MSQIKKKSQEVSNPDGFRITQDELDQLLRDEPREDVGELKMDVVFDPEEELEVGKEVLEEMEIPTLEHEEEHHESPLKLIEMKLPGSDNQDDIEIPEEEVIENPWTWKLETFYPQWCEDRMKNIPGHNGNDILGVERAIAYLEKVESEISKALRSDFDNILPVEEIEQFRDKILSGVERLEERLEQLHQFKYPNKKGKKKKKADLEEDGFVKEAGNGRAGAFSVVVPLFVSFIARTCINSTVSAGHDLTDTFKKLAKEYDLSKRERAEVMQLIQDCGYPVNWDRGMFEKDPSETENRMDWNDNRPA